MTSPLAACSCRISASSLRLASASMTPAKSLTGAVSSGGGGCAAASRRGDRAAASTRRRPRTRAHRRHRSTNRASVSTVSRYAGKSLDRVDCAAPRRRRAPAGRRRPARRGRRARAAHRVELGGVSAGAPSSRASWRRSSRERRRRLAHQRVDRRGPPPHLEVVLPQVQQVALDLRLRSARRRSLAADRQRRRTDRAPMQHAVRVDDLAVLDRETRRASARTRRASAAAAWRAPARCQAARRAAQRVQVVEASATHQRQARRGPLRRQP